MELISRLLWSSQRGGLAVFQPQMIFGKAIGPVVSLTFLLSALSPGQGAAASSGGGGSGSGNGNGTDVRQTSPGPRDLMEAGGRALTDSLRNFTRKGEGERKVWDSNDSPREAVMTFVTALSGMIYESEDGQELVKKTLPEGFAADGPEAKALLGVFERLGEIAPTDLPNKAAVEDGQLRNFEVFPYAVDHKWVWETLGKAPEGKITVEQVGETQWRFTAETLNGAEKLLDSMRKISPVYTEKTDGKLIERAFGGMFSETPWWSWLVFFAVGIGGAFAAVWLHRGLNALGRKFELNDRSVMASLLRSLSTALCIFLAVIIFVLGSSFIQFTPTVAEMYWGIVRAILLIGAVWVLFGLTDLIATLVRTHLIPDSNEYGEMAVTIAQRLFRSLLFIILLIFILENLLGINIGALIVGFGIVGLALSLAGKELAQNLFGAVSIFLNRPFVVGDWIEFNDEIGVVDDVRMQATYIRLLSGEMLIVPNMQFISNEVENLSMRKYLRTTLNISIPYGTPPEKVEKAMEVLRDVLTSEEVNKEGKTDPEERAPVVTFKGFESYYLHLMAYYWYQIADDEDVIQRNDERGWFSYLEHCRIVNLAILRAFDNAGIEFAFPTQTLMVENEG